MLHKVLANSYSRLPLFSTCNQAGTQRLCKINQQYTVTDCQHHGLRATSWHCPVLSDIHIIN